MRISSTLFLIFTVSKTFQLSQAFVQPCLSSSNVKHDPSYPLSRLQTYDNNDSSEGSPLTRRAWIRSSSFSVGGAAISSWILVKPSHSAAADISVLCDPSVSTIRHGRRVIHILGTAHISADSAQLAGRVVRELAPTAVFVELDAKRVGGITAKSGNDSNFSSTDNRLSKDQKVDTSAIIESPLAIEQAQGSGNQQRLTKLNKFNPKIMASKALGNSIQGMYRKLESEGFNAGDEFVTAVREGLAINSKIILGDQDIDVTLRRLTEALSKTDIRKLIADDSKLEAKMKDFLPVSVSKDMSKDEMSVFIEVVKTKENIKMLMAEFKNIAPELYNAIVSERDEFMADGLDRLKEFDTIVAIMGIAHVDGVEGRLKDRGWTEVSKQCAINRQQS